MGLMVTDAALREKQNVLAAIKSLQEVWTIHDHGHRCIDQPDKTGK